MGVADLIPDRIREVPVNGAVVHLRRPDRTELSEIVAIQLDQQKSLQGTVEDIAGEGFDEQLAVAAIRATVRDDEHPEDAEPILTHDEALDLAIAAAEHEGSTFLGSRLTATAMQLCRVGGIEALGKAIALSVLMGARSARTASTSASQSDAE